MMRPTKYPSSVKTVKLTLFPCLHVVSNRVNVPSDAESGSHRDSRIEVMGCLVSSVVRMEQIHPDLSLHTEMYMSEQMATSTTRKMISFFISPSIIHSGRDDTDRDTLLLCIEYGVLRSPIAAIIRSDHKGTVINHPAVSDLITTSGIGR